MLLCASCARGGPRSRTRTARRPPEGNPEALAALDEVFAVRDEFEWRGLGTIPRSGLRLADAFADWDAERRFEVPGARIEDPKACRCGDVLRGLAKPYECCVFGTACTPGAAARHVHGLERGRVRRLLRLRPAPPPRRGAGVSGDVITLADGAGGKASRRLVEGLFLEEFRNPMLEPLGDAAIVGLERHPLRVHDRLVRRTAAALPRRRHRRARRQRHRQRPRGLGRRPARAHRRVRDRGGLPGRRAARARRRRWRRAARDAGVAVAARRHEGGRARRGRRSLRDDGRCRIPRPARGARARPRPRRATGCSSPGRSPTTGSP